MDERQRRVDEIRKRSTEVENNLIDNLRAGRISRREFIRRGTVIGMSIPLLSFLAAACGGGGGSDTGGATTGGATGAPETGGATEVTTGGGAAGGSIRVGIIAPAGALDPLTVADEGGLAVLGQSGEYLAWSDKDLKLQPRIAESWSPNADGSVWTFKIRQGVSFHDGTPLTADDVAFTLNLHADPKNKGNALSAFQGVLSAGGAKATDPATVEVTLDAPNGNFPYLVSSDNYNVIILPKTYTGGWDKTFIGTGPWVYQPGSYTADQGVAYTKNPSYWDPSRQPKPDANELKFYAEEQARVLALQGGDVDVVSNFSVAGGKALLTDSNVAVIEIRASQHRQLHMRVDKPPFDKKEVRQAVALAIDRNALVQGLWEGKADIGNDSPFAPVFPSTDTTVPQRELDVEQAKQLLAGAGGGFDVTLYTWNGFEIPDLAQLVQSALKPLGINVKLQIDDPGTYYSKYWLDSPFGITDYGHRGVPNVFLTAPLQTDGPCNAAHFSNSQYDGLVKQYVAALDVDSQKAVAKQIEELLLDETPIVFPYFYYHLAATRQGVSGVDPTGMGHIDVSQATGLA